jgi:1-phosphofructokinase family hexose kinase
VLVVNPNLCFDRTLWVDRFEAGTVSRPSRVEVAPGGKGVNVVRTLRDLGRTATLVGPLPRDRGDELARRLADEGIELRGVPVDGEVRSATVIVEATGRATVLNEPGPTLGPTDLAALLQALEEELADHGDVVVCSGSLPPGLPHDTYAQVTALVRRRGGTVVVDGAREALAAALVAAPDAVTPNLAEAENLLTGATTELSHHADDVEQSRAAAFEAADALQARGARRAVVTVGAHGVAWNDEAGTPHWVPAHSVQPVNPIGAGDSFAAGLAAALADGSDWETAVRHAVAVAGAAVEHPRAGHVDPARVHELLSRSEAVR